jgi:CRISPR type III-B/RAMP module RAMP protein Cmr6
VRSCIAKIAALAADAISDDLIDAFEAELFEGVVVGKPSSNYGRDIFLDAFPVEITASNLGNRKQLFGNDYLTPHLHQNREMAHLDPFAEPRPLQFLKVMPMVRYEFHFILKPSLAIPAMDATKKRKLLEALLCFHGIGAKTNVGYGQFAQQQELSNFFENKEVEATGPENPGPSDDDDVAKRIDPQDFVNRVVPGASPLEAVVVNSILKRVRIRVKGKDHEVQLAGNCPASVGDFIGVKINTVDRNGNITQVGYIGPYRPK